MSDKSAAPNNDRLTTRGFTPLHTERDHPELILEGNWPSELRGSLYRIGPNPQFDPIGTYNPFLGDGMVHAFHIDQGRVAYRNRWVRTQQWQLEHQAGRALFATSGDPRDHDPSVGGQQTDGVANTNLIWHAHRLLCLEESHAPIEIDPLTLETRGPHTFSGALPSNFTAHPKIDPNTGELVGFANYPRGKFNGEVACYLIDAAGELTQQLLLKMPYGSLIHDFAMTENYLVFIVAPVTISIPRAMSGGPPTAWEADKAVQVAVLDRHDLREGNADKIRWFEREACFVWHTLNAFDTEDQITLDLCEQAAPAFPAPDGSMPAKALYPTYLCRWEIDLQGDGQVRHSRLADEVVEYPTFDERFAGQPISQGYFAGGGGLGTSDIFHHQVNQYHFGSGAMESYDFGPNSDVHEPIFVPRHPNAGESDGYLLTVVYDENSTTSRLVLFDTQSISAGPIATALVPTPVPVGFHGAWRAWN